MLPILPALSLIPRWKWILGGIILLLSVGLYFYVTHLQQNIETLQESKKALSLQLQQQSQVNQENLVELENLKKTYQANIDALTEAKKTAQERERFISTLRERIRNVRPENEGAIAPVLRDTLDELRQRTTPTPSGKDADRASITSPGVVRVPSYTSSPHNG